MDITAVDVENLVVGNGCPETLVVSNDDFASIYGVYRNMNRDDDGAFILALNTKIRPTSKPVDKVVDISTKAAFADKAAGKAVADGAKK